MFINLIAYCGNLYWELRPEGQDWMYDVHILEKMDDYNFRADVADRVVEGQRNEFALTFCHDFQPTTEIVAGVTLEYLTYSRDIHLHCFEISKPRYGYKIKRGEHNVPIINASFARRSEP